MEIMRRNAVVKNQETKQRGQRILGDCWQWETNGQCSKGDNCSFRHDINKICKIDTAESVSKFFHAAEWEKCVENPKSQRKKSQWWTVSMAMQGFLERNLHQLIHSVKSGTLQNACSTNPRVVADLGKSAHTRIVRLMNNRLKGPKRMMTKVQ